MVVMTSFVCVFQLKHDRDALPPLQGIRDDQFAPVCVVVDKLDKIGPDEVIKDLVMNHGILEATAQNIIKTMSGRHA